MHTSSCWCSCWGWHSMFQTQVCPVWEGFTLRSICDSERERPSDGTHFQDQLSNSWTSTPRCPCRRCQPVPSLDQVDLHLEMQSYSTGMDQCIGEWQGRIEWFFSLSELLSETFPNDVCIAVIADCKYCAFITFPPCWYSLKEGKWYNATCCKSLANTVSLRSNPNTSSSMCRAVPPFPWRYVFNVFRCAVISTIKCSFSSHSGCSSSGKVSPLLMRKVFTSSDMLHSISELPLSTATGLCYAAGDQSTWCPSHLVMNGTDGDLNL